MFDAPSETLPSCPKCGGHIADDLGGRADYTCSHCDADYRVLRDADGTAMALLDVRERPVIEPLNLPTGSIRALMSLAMVATCWGLLLQERPLPSALTSLVLTIVGFYFGFRTKAATLGDRVYDPAAQREQPLRLPAGAIRSVLVVAVLGIGYWLIHRDLLLAVEGYLEFLVILVGLILGHYSGRSLAGVQGRGAQVAIAHIKGVVGLAVAGALAGLLLTGLDAQTHPAVMTILAATVSFYFGTRSA